MSQERKLSITRNQDIQGNNIMTSQLTKKNLRKRRRKMISIITSEEKILVEDIEMIEEATEEVSEAEAEEEETEVETEAEEEEEVQSSPISTTTKKPSQLCDTFSP